MASRRSTRNLPAQHSRAHESMEEKWKRLRLDWYEEYSAGGKWQDTPAPHLAAPSKGTPGGKPWQKTSVTEQSKARKDEPLVRHLRRGTTTDALKALEGSGAQALIDHLIKDRYAKGTAEANLSLIRTWHQFHEIAFGHAHPPVPLLPLTPRILIMIGSLFKAGGYRSYPKLRLHHENQAH